MNPRREGKKLLVLDIDYTLFDHRYECGYLSWYKSYLISYHVRKFTFNYTFFTTFCSDQWLRQGGNLCDHISTSSWKQPTPTMTFAFGKVTKTKKSTIQSNRPGQQPTWGGLRKRWNCLAVTRIQTTISPSIWTPEQWSQFRQKSMGLLMWSLWGWSGASTLSMTRRPRSCLTTWGGTSSWTPSRASRSGLSGAHKCRKFHLNWDAICREAHKNRGTDRELVGLAKYLTLIAKLDDFSNLRWALANIKIQKVSGNQAFYTFFQAQPVGKVQPGAQLMQYLLKIRQYFLMLLIVVGSKKKTIVLNFKLDGENVLSQHHDFNLWSRLNIVETAIFQYALYILTPIKHLHKCELRSSHWTIP